MNRFGLPATGWSYCPRCDKETMIATTAGERFECPFCGLGMTVTETPPGHISLNADGALTMEEAVKYRNYLMSNYSLGEPPTHPQCRSALVKPEGYKIEAAMMRPPLRVRICYRLYILIGKLLRCRPGAIIDLTKLKGGENKDG